MKEKTLIDDNQSALIGEDIKVVTVAFRKRKTSLVEKFDSLPIHLKEAKQVSDYLLETQVKYQRLMDKLSDYENTVTPPQRDPFIQWIINNKRYVTKEAFTRLTPKLTDLVQLLNNHQSLVPNHELRKTSEHLMKQYEQLNKDIIETTQSIERRTEELKLLADEHSELNHLIKKVTAQEKILFTDYEEILIEKDSNRTKNNAIVITLISKMRILISGTPVGSECIIDVEVLNNLDADDRRTILNVSRQGVTLMNATKLLLKKNTHAIMLEEERLEKRERIILEAHNKLVELYNTIKDIILYQPFKSLNTRLNSEKKIYDECITLVLSTNNHLKSASQEEYALYLLDFSTIQSKLHKKIACFAPNTAYSSEKPASSKIKVNQKIVNDHVDIELNTESVNDVIKNIQETRIKTETDSKTKAYQEVIASLKEANALLIPFLVREEKYNTNNAQLNAFKNEINTLIKNIEESPIYSQQIFYKKNDIIAFVNDKNKINYSDCETMDDAVEVQKRQKDNLIKMLNQSIINVTTRYVQRLNALETRLETQLNDLENELEHYRPSLRGRLDTLNQLNRPINPESTLFFGNEIMTFEHCKNIIDVELDALENTKMELASAESERRTKSQEVQFIVDFIDAIFLDDNPPVIIQLQRGLQAAMNEYIDRKKTKIEFYTAIEQTIQDTLLAPDTLEQFASYDTKPFKHFIRTCLQLINSILEFFTQTFKIEDDSKPSFFSKIPNEITKCELAIAAEKARVVLLALSNTNEARDMPKFSR